MMAQGEAWSELAESNPLGQEGWKSITKAKAPTTTTASEATLAQGETASELVESNPLRQEGLRTTYMTVSPLSPPLYHLHPKRFQRSVDGWGTPPHCSESRPPV